MTDFKNFGKNFSIRKFSRRVFEFPDRKFAALSAFSAILLILAFPDFEFYFLAWFAFTPLFFALEKNKNSTAKCFWLGLLCGTIFFYASCWWLTFAPIHYGGLPAPIIYFLLLPATLGAGFFVGIFAAIFGRVLSKFGHYGILSAPIIWTSCEFLRLLVTGNAWNALGYSLAFKPSSIQLAAFGGVFVISFLLVLANCAFSIFFIKPNLARMLSSTAILLLLICVQLYGSMRIYDWKRSQAEITENNNENAVVVALQPNVPMSGLTYEKYGELRRRHVEMTEAALQEIDTQPKLKDLPRVVVFPESPMNFAWARDAEFREFVKDFTRRNRISLIFNAGEPDAAGEDYYNSAVMINPLGEKIRQYDKIRLVPFGEYVPEWLPGNELLPTVVGRMKPGRDFRLMPFGARAQAGTLICYESAFGDLSAEFVRKGADVLIEMTNDGYGGDTPILRQHLANAVFRAVETNRPLLRVTNIGITARINERGEIFDAAPKYDTATRIWIVAKSDGKKTFYVRCGDLFAWICFGLSLVLLALTFVRRK
jgi:apolipoprotein N-acyltransferase